MLVKKNINFIERSCSKHLSPVLSLSLQTHWELKWTMRPSNGLTLTKDKIWTIVKEVGMIGSVMLFLLLETPSLGVFQLETISELLSILIKPMVVMSKSPGKLRVLEMEETEKLKELNRWRPVPTKMTAISAMSLRLPSTVKTS